ncbi:MAG: NAD-dependent epimerase/dehydratase family protein [Treponema sp.]|jgi:nucleoside-diphosphate-sugar epimerase|nr:NAD-dependent epimerase/dehydratase family protein [Treponema sp.]
MKTALVCGTGGFIGNHTVSRLKGEGYWVRGVDLRFPKFSQPQADDFILGDLRIPDICDKAPDRRFDEALSIGDAPFQAKYRFPSRFTLWKKLISTWN